MASWDDVVAMGLELPETEVGTWYGTPGIKVKGKGFVRLRDEDGLVVVMIDMLEREALMQSNPKAFLITPHYEDYPAMLIDLASAPNDELRELVIESWRRKAPKKLLRAYDTEHPPA
ncbi:hypothetical protein BH10ACT11_BH10ACT11_12470 [soil metagenome]